MIKNFIRNFMAGRYGPDHLNVAMIVVSLALSLLHAILGFSPIMYVSYAILALVLYRMFSRNIRQRRKENDRFLRYWWPLRTRVRRFPTYIRQRKTHKFFQCPGCRNSLRVPRGKGKLQITCPKCAERFTRKT